MAFINRPSCTMALSLSWGGVFPFTLYGNGTSLTTRSATCGLLMICTSVLSISGEGNILLKPSSPPRAVGDTLRKARLGLIRTLDVAMYSVGLDKR